MILNNDLINFHGIVSALYYLGLASIYEKGNNKAVFNSNILSLSIALMT